MHFEKYTKGQCKAIIEHNKHTKERDNIDKNLTDKNYYFDFGTHGEMSDHEYLEHRLEDLTYREQKNNIVLGSWVVSLPRDFHGDEERFFLNCATFLAKRYGSENVVSAVVHRDEPGAADHLHFQFVPAYYDKEHDVERLGCKHVVDRMDMKTIHKDLEHYLEREHTPAHLLTGATKSKEHEADLYRYRDEFMEREFGYYIKQDPDFYSRMDTYVNKQIELDRDVREIEKEQTIDRDRQIERER